MGEAIDDEIEVSICCIAYNHEKYIRRCIEGFLIQKTTLRYEIIIHDDASTDRTADIIKEYEMKYPHLIRGIYQTENQTSKGIHIGKYIYLQAKGKYIAICEGDDFWISPDKLQKQYDALEAHPDCRMAVHRVREVAEDGTKTGRYYGLDDTTDGILESKEFVHQICVHYCFQTSSYFVTSADMKSYHNNRPEFSLDIDVGDEPLCLYFGQLGNVFYFDEEMSCRRIFAVGSWSSRQKNMSVQRHFDRIKKIQIMMERYDMYTNYRFHEICQERIDEAVAGQFGILTNHKQYKKLLQKEYKMLRKNWSWKYRVYVLVGAYFPILFKIMNNFEK